jgi:hypothetical protein
VIGSSPAQIEGPNLLRAGGGKRLLTLP